MTDEREALQGTGSPGLRLSQRDRKDNANMGWQLTTGKTGGGAREKARVYGVLTLLSLGGVSVVLLATSRYGAGTSMDSSAYVAAARSLLEGEGYLNADGTPYTHWPPLFPTLIALAGLGGIDALDAARWLNALAFGGIIFLAGLLFLGSTASRALALIGVLAVALSGPLLDVSVMAWSEPVFVLLTLLFLLGATRFLHTRSRASFVLVSAAAALACLQRYVGVTVILAGCVVIGLGLSGMALQPRLRALAGFCLASAGPLTAWFLWNHVHAGQTAGTHHFEFTSAHGTGRAIAAAVGILAEWFVPGSKCLQTKEVYHSYATELASWLGPWSDPVGVRAAAVGGMLLLGALAVLGSRRTSSASNHRPASPIGPVVVFALAYLGFLIVYSMGVSWDPFTHRHLVPLYIPMVCLVFAGMERAWQLLGELLAHPRAGRSLGLVLCAVWLLHPLDHAQGLVRLCLRDGAGGYSSAAWQESPLIAWLRANRPPGRAYSNAPEALYLLVDIPVRATPHWRWGDAERASNLPSSQMDYVVWCHNHYRGYYNDLRELRSRWKMTQVAAFPDGRVYRFLGEGGPAVSGVYRFARPDRHFYTICKTERDELIQGGADAGKYEGLAFYAFAPEGERPPDVLPVYRLWSARSRAHFFTLEEAEKNRLLQDLTGGWTCEGIAFYAWRQAGAADAVPVHRFWSERLGYHFYTADEKEKTRLITEFSHTWTYEGIAWYAYGPLVFP
jgi:hypothetical protein